MGRVLLGLLLALPAVAAPTSAPVVQDWLPTMEKSADGAWVVELKLKRCLIPELDTEVLPLRADKAADCERLNRATRVIRESGIRRLRLKTGKYVFRVRNLDVPWALDLELRGAHDKSLPLTQGGHIEAGQVYEYPITLAPGVYVLRSPLNATYLYDVLVEE